MAATSGQEWHVAESGTDSNGCGDVTNPCASLGHVINKTETNAHVFIHTPTGSGHVFQHCSARIVSMNLTIEGVGGKQPFLGCDVLSEVEFVDSGVTKNRTAAILFHFRSNAVTLVNLFLKTGYILTADSVLNVYNSTIDEAALYLMDEFSFGYHHQLFKGSFRMHSLMTQMHKWYLLKQNSSAIQDWMYVDPTIQFRCSSVELNVENVTWTHTNLRYSDLIPVDVLRRDGIQVICVSFTINVHGSFLSDRIIFAAGVELPVLHIHNSVFNGSNNGSNIMGGVEIASLCSPYLVIEDTIFQGLRFADLSYALLANDMFDTAALRMRIFKHEFQEFCKFCKEEEHHAYNPQIAILNATFRNNMGGVAISVEENDDNGHICLSVTDVLLVYIFNSKFIGNEKVGNGGAVKVSFGNPIKMYVKNCDFSNNRAGVAAFNTPIQTTGKPVLSTDWIDTLKGYEIIDDMVVLTMGPQEFSSNAPRDFNITMHFAGLGGAFYWLQGQLTVQDSRFYNNSASRFGGALFVSERSKVYVRRTDFYSGDDALNGTSGLVLYSHAEMLSLSEVTITVAATPRNKAAVLYHEEDAFHPGLFQFTNIKVCCSPDTKLNLLTSSSRIKFSLNVYLTNQRLSYRAFELLCEACATNSYTLQTGQYKVTGPEEIFAPALPLKKAQFPVFGPPPPPPISIAVTYTHNITHIDFPCIACPYGAACEGGLQSKFNYWGFRSGNQVVFYECPFGYCCNRRRCDSYNQCAAFRGGTLCGQCEAGYSEALFSVRCIPNRECHDTWILGVGALMSMTYALFLIFQNDLKASIFAAPIGAKSVVPSLHKKRSNTPKEAIRVHEVDAESHSEVPAMTTDKKSSKRRHVVAHRAVTPENTDNCQKEPKKEPLPEPEHETRPAKEQRTQEEGGIFLILLFYYFQDASIIQITTPYTDPDDYVIRVVKKIIGGLFKFQLNILQFATSVCLFENSNPAMKVALKVLFIPTIFSFLSLLSCMSKLLANQRKVPGSILAQKLEAKVPVAVMLAILFSFQKLATSAFSLVYCVPFENQSVLFIDGTLECYTNWQIIIIVYISLSIVPFCLYITFATTYLKNGGVSLGMFFVGCFLPVPVLGYIILRTRIMQTDKKQERNCGSVYELLQGPYKDYQVTLHKKQLTVCYSGILLMRRTLLILFHTFIHNVSLRLLLMMLLCIVQLTLQTHAQPCKERRSNVAAFVSSFSLVLVSSINLIRAVFVTAEYEPIGPIAQFSDVMNFTEECLLLWIPVVGISCVLLVIIMRTVGRLLLKVRKA